MGSIFRVPVRRLTEVAPVVKQEHTKQVARQRLLIALVALLTRTRPVEQQLAAIG